MFKTKMRRNKRAIEAAAEPEIALLEVIDAETVCAVCSAEFLDGEDLKLHIIQVHLHESNGKTICRLCYSIFCSADEFVTHLIYKHLENVNFCFYCYRAFLCAKDEHEQKHHVALLKRGVTCSQCTRIFTNRQILQEHEYAEHRDNEGVMLNSIFSLLSSALNIPMRKFMKSLSKNQSFTCNVCNYTSFVLSDYINHLSTWECQSYCCDKCYKVFKKKSGIQRHLSASVSCQNFFREHEQCNKCEKQFDVNDLANHMASCFAVKCPTCNVIFDNIQDLTEHRLKEHNISVSLTVCKFCKREFVGNFNLKKHMKRSHRNYKLYKYRCAHCDAIFIHPSKLFGHYFTKHKTIQPYTCKICNKKFRLRKQFTIHIKMIHKSIGFVEFDENFHVFFSDKKSENPFKPSAEHLGVSMDDSDDNSQLEIDESVKTEDTDIQLAENNEQSTEKVDESINTGNVGSTEKTNDQSAETSNAQTSQFNETPDADNKIPDPEDSSLRSANQTISDTEKDIDSDENNLLIVKKRLIKAKFKNGHKRASTMKRKRKARPIKQSPAKRFRTNKSNIDLSDDEPLSSVRELLLAENDQNTTSLKTRRRKKGTKLTCKICNKYCYTVQNYHHHVSLHENTKMKGCIKCHEKFKSKDELKNHIDRAHSSSKLTETLKTMLEKRKKFQPDNNNRPAIRPADSIKSLVEKRKKTLLRITQTATVNKFRKTIKKVDVSDNCKATITPMSDHGLSVKNFIENFRPDAADTINISNSVTIKTIDSTTDKQPLIKMKKFTEVENSKPGGKLKLPVKFRGNVIDTKNQVKVTLVQQLITKPKLLNLSMDERIPVMSPPPQPEYSEYCNTFADDTDYTQYKNEATIPDVAHEVMLGDADDVPRTRQLAQEIFIPNIPDKYGGVRIGHLLPDAPFYKIVKVKKLLKGESDSEPDEIPADKNIKLPDGTQLVTVKNPFSHLIQNEHLEEVLKANRNKYYTPKTKNIEKALAKALKEKPVVKTRVKGPGKKRGRKKKTAAKAGKKSRK